MSESLCIFVLMSTKLSISEYGNIRKVVLVNFWVTRIGLQRHIIKKFLQMYEYLNTKPVTTLHQIAGPMADFRGSIDFAITLASYQLPKDVSEA